MIKVFLATANPLLKKSANQIIADVGASAIAAGSSLNESLRTCRLEHPSICLIDLFLPPTTGLDLIRKIREIKMDEEPRIVLLSLLKNRTILERALRLGANDVLAHPFSMDELKQTILHYSRSN